MNALYPEFFARFYDLIYSSILSGKDTEYYLQKLREAHGPVLEVGTGTGRFFIEALNRGADMNGNQEDLCGWAGLISTLVSGVKKPDHRLEPECYQRSKITKSTTPHKAIVGAANRQIISKWMV